MKKKLCRASPQGMWETLEKHKLKTQHSTKTTYKQSNMTKNRGNNRQTEAHSTLQVAAAVFGTSTSIARFSLLFCLVPCYTLSAGFVLRSSAMPHPRRACVR